MCCSPHVYYYFCLLILSISPHCPLLWSLPTWTPHLHFSVLHTLAYNTFLKKENWMSLSSFIKTFQWFVTASESNSFAWKTGPSPASPPLLALYVKLGVHPQKVFSALEMPPLLLSLQGCCRVSFLLMECCDMGHKHTLPPPPPPTTHTAPLLCLFLCAYSFLAHSGHGFIFTLSWLLFFTLTQHKDRIPWKPRPSFYLGISKYLAQFFPYTVDKCVDG